MGAGDPPFCVPYKEFEGGSEALLFLSSMLAKDSKKDKFSAIPPGEVDGPEFKFGGAENEWKVEKLSGESDGALERLDSKMSGVGLKRFVFWLSAGSDSRDWVNLPRSENKGLEVTLPKVNSIDVQPITNLTSV